MSVQDDLQKIEQIKEDIHTAIKDKDVIISDDTPFEQYASKIDSIKGSGPCNILKINPTPNDATVSFTNSKGTTITPFYNQAACTQGSLLNYSVTKEGYRPYSNSITLNQNQELSITLTDLPYRIMEDSCGLLILTNDGTLYGSGLANPNSTTSSDIIPYFSLIATNVKDACCISQAYCYLTNDNVLYMKGLMYPGSSSFSINYRLVSEHVKKLGVHLSQYQIFHYIDEDDNLYLKGTNNYSEQGISKYSENPVKTFTKRAENVKEFFCNASSSYYIDNNDDLYFSGSRDRINGTFDYTYFQKIAENVKEVCPCYGGDSTYYISKDDELYGCSAHFAPIDSSGSNMFKKYADNVRECRSSESGNNTGLLHYITKDNKLYGSACQMGWASGGSILGNGKSDYTTYNNVLLSENCVTSIMSTDSHIAAYLSTDGEIFATGEYKQDRCCYGLQNHALYFTKVAEGEKLYPTSNQSTPNFIYYNNGYYVAGANARGRLGIDNSQAEIITSTLIDPLNQNQNS